jgi:hypothetical protein
MKGLRKNIYAIGVIFLFVIAAGMLALFLALFSSSTAVDGTTVGSVYIGDTKPNSDKRKEKLEKDIRIWKANAIYTISFQNVSFTIGEEEETIIDETTGQETTKPLQKGLDILDFDYTTTNSKIVSNTANNVAYFTISDANKEKLFDKLVETYGTEITDSSYLDYQKLLDYILRDAGNMNTKSDYDLYDFLIKGQLEEVATAEIENLSQEKIDDILEVFEGVSIEIKPQKDPEGKLGFSAVEFFSQPEYKKLSSSDMSIIATGMAAVVMKTSLTVTVKNQGFSRDRYYGYLNSMTARINLKDDTDLRIINPETHSYFITIEKGYDSIAGKVSLRFKLEGCKFLDSYEIRQNHEEFDYHIVFNEYQTDDWEIDPNNKIDYDGTEVYYRVVVAGSNTELFSYTKVITHINGEVEEVEVFPKQEFFQGKDEILDWQPVK